MNPSAVAVELARHGARFVVAGNAVTLRFPPERPPPADLVEAARHHKDALRALTVAHAATARDLGDRLTQLADGPAPAGFSLHRWLDAVAGAVAFSEQWTEVALQLGWSPLDLFGLHPIAPAARLDCKGLAWMLEHGARVAELTAEGATIRTRSGSLLGFYKPQATPEACCLDDQPDGHQAHPEFAHLQQRAGGEHMPSRVVLGEPDDEPTVRPDVSRRTYTYRKP